MTFLKKSNNGSNRQAADTCFCCLKIPTKRIGLADFPEFSRSSKNCPFSNPNPCLLYSRKWQYCQICTFWTYFWVLWRNFFCIIWGLKSKTLLSNYMRVDFSQKKWHKIFLSRPHGKPQCSYLSETHTFCPSSTWITSKL